MNQQESLIEDFYFQWHITNKCNNRCKHCYHDNYSEQNELSIDQLLQVADEIEDALDKWNFKGALSITGGEPFTREDALYEIMNKFESSEKVASIDILTNGSLVSETEIDILKRFKRLRRIQVSLEGFTAQSHDAVRGSRDYEKVINAIQLFKKHGLTVSVMTTLTNNNRNEIITLLEMLGDLNVDYFSLERFMPEGQSEGLLDWTLSKEEIKKTFNDVTEWGINHSKPTVLLYRTLYALCNPNNETVGAMCSAGINALTIMPDGTLYACRRLPIPLGNVLKEGIISTWYSSEMLWSLRDVNCLKGKCRTCEYIEKCRGCRSMAYAMTGDYLEEDPQCWK